MLAGQSTVLASVLLALAAGDAEPLPPGATARLGTTRLRTTATALALTPDGRTLLTAARGRTVGRWDPESGRLLGETYLPAPADERCWFTPDARAVAVPDEKGIGLYDLATGKRSAGLAVEDSSKMTVAAFSPDGRSLATAEYISNGDKSAGRVRLWPVAGGRPRDVAELPSYVNGLAFSPDGERLFAAVDNHSLRCWDVATARELWRNDHWARHVAVSADGKLLASDTYQDGPVRLWDAGTGKGVATLDPGGKNWPLQLAFSPDGKVLAHGTARGVFLWDVGARKQLHHLQPAGGHLAFTADSRSLFTLGPLLERWDVRTGRPLYPDARAGGHVGPVTGLAFAPGGRALATTGADGTVRVWDLGKGTHAVVTDRPRSPGPALAYTPDGLLLLPGVGSGTLALVDPKTGREVRSFALPQQRDFSTNVTAAALTPDGRTLFAVGSAQGPLGGSIIFQRDELVRGWEVATGKEVLATTVRLSIWPSPGLSPRGQVAARTDAAELVDLRTGRRRPLAGNPFLILSPTFSPDGRLLALAEQGGGGRWQSVQTVRTYEVLTGRPLARTEGSLGGVCTALAFSPDGRLLAAASQDALHVWEARTGRRVWHLPVRGKLPHWSGVRGAECLAFSPDGRTLATGHADGVVYLWDLAPALARLTAPKGPIDPDACWADLAEADPRAALAAAEELASEPKVALPLFRRHLRAVKVDARWLAARIADLSADDFSTREAATKALARVAEAAEPDLRAALEKAPPEARRRLAEILDAARLAVPDTDTVRALRAVAVLERIGSGEARALLKDLAGGAGGASLTREAGDALLRLRR